jgi:hypothetical protein
LEHRTEPNGAFDQSGIVGVFENDPGQPDDVADSNQPTGRCDTGAQRLEIIRCEVIDATMFAECSYQPIARLVVVAESQWRQFA